MSKGIDIFFDNVGGDVLDAALARLAMRGRVVLCGGIANYNATDYISRAAEVVGALAGGGQAGKIKNKVDMQHGLENAPSTLRRLFDGCNGGKRSRASRSKSCRKSLAWMTF